MQCVRYCTLYQRDFIFPIACANLSEDLYPKTSFLCPPPTLFPFLLEFPVILGTQIYGEPFNCPHHLNFSSKDRKQICNVVDQALFRCMFLPFPMPLLVHPAFKLVGFCSISVFNLHFYTHTLPCTYVQVGYSSYQYG